MDRLLAAAPAASWGDSLNEYRSITRTRPFPDEAYQKPARVTHYQKSREESLYNPVLQTFTNQSSEAEAKEWERSNKIRLINIARDKQIARGSPYDLLTSIDKRAGLTPPAQPEVAKVLPVERPKLRHPLDSCVPYNIMSNLPLATHHYANPDLRPKDPETTGDPAYAKKGRLQHVVGLPREFDVLSNRYVENHEGKIANENAIKRNASAIKYWETHDYDPLLVTFVDPEKEAQFHKAKEAELREQPMKQFNRLPPSLQKGEGYVYDITTHQVKNNELYDKKEREKQAYIDAKSITWSRPIEMRERGVERAALEAQRAINRSSHTRFTESIQHGYNIIDMRDYRDPNVFVAPPQTRPHLTTWQKVGPVRAPNAPQMPKQPPPGYPLKTQAQPRFLLSASAPSAVRTGGFQ